jgi:signal transduction histidine kinase
MRQPASIIAPFALSPSTRQLLNPQIWYFPAGLAVFLIAIAQFNFLVFHTLVELFAVIVSFMLFAFAWYTNRFSRDHLLLYIACGMFWVGALDIAHTLTYKGMKLLPTDDANIPTQIWIGTRYLQALTLFSAPLLGRRSIDKLGLFAGFGLLATLLLLWIGYGEFPDAFVEGRGLTPFKIGSEYLIMTILAGAILVIRRHRRSIPPDALPFLQLSAVFAIGTELAFTFYVDVYGLSNLVGHILKLFCFWAIFQAIVVARLVRPYLDLGASTRAKDDFLASMSHDLRTPLNSILGFSDMIRSRMFGPLGHGKYEEYIANIHASGTHLLSLVNDLLDLSKLESGQYQINRQDIHPRILVEETIRSFAPSIGAKDLTVHTNCSADCAPVFADERAMVQLMNNLISNAVKFTPDHGLITVSCQSLADGAVRFEVSDTGIGIPADQIRRLGNPYAQVNPYVAQEKGTGLGLFIVRRIADLHGGSLDIRSKPGSGTTVTVIIPREPA